MIEVACAYIVVQWLAAKPLREEIKQWRDEIPRYRHENRAGYLGDHDRAGSFSRMFSKWPLALTPLRA
jgi:hypothetical protein